MDIHTDPIEGINSHGSHRDWEIRENVENGNQGKVREFCEDWKSQEILLKILEKWGKIILEN